MVDLYLKASEARFVANKDPNAVLDYTWYWTEYLDAVVDTISTFTITTDGGVVVASSALVGTKQVRAFISGGVIGTPAKATCRITTNSTPPRVDDRTIYFNIVDR